MMQSLRLAYRPRTKLAVAFCSRCIRFIKYAGEGQTQCLCSPAWKEQLILLGCFVDCSV